MKAVRSQRRIYETIATHCGGFDISTITSQRDCAATSAELVALGGSVRYHKAASRFTLRHVLPVDTFATSVYSVPFLLCFRLFYQASPFPVKAHSDICSAQHVQIRETQQQAPRKSSTLGHSNTCMLEVFARHRVIDFDDYIRRTLDEADSLKICSLTWVKALASPLSHEYIQCIVRDVASGRRYRIVADRSDQGDIVIIGWNWTSGAYASHHHVLPLPLLTIEYDDESQGPPLSELSSILAATSQRKPYRLFREMCWWYAESVFTSMHDLPHRSKVKEWRHGNLRYSFIVRTEWLQRESLTREAEAFRQQNMEETLY